MELFLKDGNQRPQRQLLPQSDCRQTVHFPVTRGSGLASVYFPLPSDLWGEKWRKCGNGMKYKVYC